MLAFGGELLRLWEGKESTQFLEVVLNLKDICCLLYLLDYVTYLGEENTGRVKILVGRSCSSVLELQHFCTYKVFAEYTL